MKLYEIGGEEVQALVQTAIERWHGELSEARAAVLAILVEESDPDKPPLNHGGYPVLAYITVVPLADRLTKEHDAELFINRDAWLTLTESQRLALIDHELSHLAVKRKSGVIQRDQFGRPKLGLVKGDWNVGDGFKEVVERHGLNAAEFENIRRAHAFAASLIKS